VLPSSLGENAERPDSFAIFSIEGGDAAWIANQRVLAACLADAGLQCDFYVAAASAFAVFLQCSELISRDRED
jgi:hypothetical protein